MLVKLAVGVFLLIALGMYTHAQPVKRNPLSQIWKIAQVDETRVDVIDTGGVCIYVSDGYNSGGIAVLSKTLLPLGHGCQ